MVSLENEYFNEKQLLENAQARLKEMEELDVENMTQDQLEARERVIKGVKEDIKESEEILEEIKEELVEFIDNGGEVSEKTKEEINYFEPIRVDFKIISNRNPEVYTEGYVEINDEEAEDVDWYYYDAQGMPTPQMFIEHDGVDGFRGATDEQKWEVEQFRGDYGEDAFWIDNVILQSEEGENRTHVRENLTLIINEGAKMECEVRRPLVGDWGDWMMELIPKFNGEKIALGSFLYEHGLLFDPYMESTEENASIDEDTHQIFFEMSKDYFEGDDEDREANMEFINNEARYIFAQMLTLEAKIGDRYGDVLEQCLDGETDDEWLFKFYNAIKNDTVDELIENEGFEIP